ncbi:tripartite tricarboxylate transporter substrate binding protein [Delftia tsuruhatensis]|uniref:ABC transporter substrate-binding protein n=1 Tax=Delftia tsuruhatensis TaxID=180282 RepID=A0ABM6DZ42_9BURK|nr:tripartite tricarboxylate transporter substrate binding protein [Delftia tsuruhatensis]AOV00174.1 ABC transporter substrate-binding protein [Delftia tsuruhatensis]MDH2232776.1 tripartite tricarboxylate transporter substrate binding protein [Delftia tsuruhatensis]
MNKAIALLLAAAATAAAAPGFAQSDYPSKPIKLIAPYAPGGSVDVLARTLATHLSTELKQSVVVENRPGANTMIAASAVARSPADGYTLLLASNASMVLNPLLYKKLSYNPDRELKLTNILAEAPLVLVTNSQTGIKNVADLKAYSKADAGKLNYSSVGLGNPLQLTTELIKSRLDVAATHIPFNGSAPALTALMANDTQLMVDVAGTSLPHIKAGKLVAIATTGPERSQFLPQTPTIAESGVPGFRASTWFGIAVPAGTPADARNTLQAAVNKVMLNPEFASALGNQTLAARKPQTQAQLDDFLAADGQMWRKVIADNAIALEN